MSGTPARHVIRLVAASVLAGILAAILVPDAFAGRGMETILQDDAQLLHRSDAEVDANMATVRRLGVTRVRLTAGWSTIAPNPDAPERPAFDATDPAAYPPHAWNNLDRAVRLAHRHGLKVNIDIAFWAPLWATKDTQPGRARAYISPEEYAGFATAVARRYSGSFTPPDESKEQAPPPSSDATWLDRLLGKGGKPSEPAPPPKPARTPLPRVDLYTLWNEPNLKGFLTPQWVKRDGQWLPESPHVYRRLALAGYHAVKAVDPAHRVLVGGTASTGKRAGDAGSITPLRFLREMACVDADLQPLQREECRDYARIPGDGWAHHPYSLYKEPGQRSTDPEHVTISELDRLTTLLDALVERGRIAPGLADVWLTEFGYETNDEVRTKPFSGAQQARLLAWSEFLAWRNPRVRSHAQFLLRDINTRQAVESGGRRRPDGSWQSGLYHEDGRPKPAAAAFPLTVWAQAVPPAVRRSRSGRARAAKATRAILWAHLRTATGPTTVRVERLRTGRLWRRAKASARTGSVAGSPGEVATDEHGFLELTVPYDPSARYRIVVRGSDGQWLPGSIVRPLEVAARAAVKRTSARARAKPRARSRSRR